MMLSDAALQIDLDQNVSTVSLDRFKWLILTDILSTIPIGKLEKNLCAK